MGIGKIVIIRRPFELLSAAFEASPVAVGTGWSAFGGKNGTSFGAQGLDGAFLMMPFVGFGSDDELAVQLREILGDFLDGHEDERGIFALAAGTPPEERSYDALVSGEGSWLGKIAADDPRVKKETGSLFSAFAQTLREAIPEAEQRVEARPADEDPFGKAQEKFDEALAARSDRGALRKSLSAAIDHSLEDSPLGKFLTPPDHAERKDLEKAESELADPLERALGANPKKAVELESLLRGTVEQDLKDVAKELGATEAAPPADDAAKPES